VQAVAAQQVVGESSPQVASTHGWYGVLSAEKRVSRLIWNRDLPTVGSKQTSRPVPSRRRWPTAMPPGENPVKASAIGEFPGLGQQRPPFAGVSDWERGPLAEGAAARCEGQCLAGGDQRGDPQGSG
jgi:hypothetical protein